LLHELTGAWPTCTGRHVVACGSSDAFSPLAPLIPAPCPHHTHTPARPPLLSPPQGQCVCTGSCMEAPRRSEKGGPCWECYETPDPDDCSFALDMGNARWGARGRGWPGARGRWPGAGAALRRGARAALQRGNPACWAGTCTGPPPSPVSYHPHRSAPGVDVVPTFTTNNGRICLLLDSCQIGMLRTEDAERLQVGSGAGPGVQGQGAPLIGAGVRGQGGAASAWWPALGGWR
jgi:hypothetical protein